MTHFQDLKEKLPRTWSLFFARYGGFTEIQQRAIPQILAGQDLLLIAPTASGKTEAVVAPLVERYGQANTGLRVLYICPTRALVRDLYGRLANKLGELQLPISMKTGDTAPLKTDSPPTFLITTPESVDSLLTRHPRLFLTVEAVVLDEIHLLDGTVRGDQTRCLLRRIERIRTYQQAERVPAQRVALSATVSDPTGLASRFLQNPTIVSVPHKRQMETEIVAMYGYADLVKGIAGTSAKKILLFCNSRREVEQIAAYLRTYLPYQAAIFVHYSNLDAQLRQQIEKEFAEASVALCVCTSTLELGIDIGSIAQIALVGPPPSLSSFLQRVGRSGRRTGVSRVLCLARTPLEWVRFQGLLDLCEQGSEADWQTTYAFRPSVLAQQLFSLLKQSPTGAVRLADVEGLVPEEELKGKVPALLRSLTLLDYLQRGHPGEWRPGPKLTELVDNYEIYSNISGEQLRTTLLDAYTGRRIAQVGRPHFKGETLLMGGKPVQVAWRDRFVFAVKKGQTDESAEDWRTTPPPMGVPLEIGQAVARYIGLAPGQLAAIPADDGGLWLFHFWGDLYGEWLAAILRAYLPTEDFGFLIQPRHEFCLYLPMVIREMPAWDEPLALQQLKQITPRIESALQMGRFHALLPPDIAWHAVLAQCDLPRFASLYQSANLVTPAPLRDSLLSLL